MADGKIKITTLLQPIVELDEKLVNSELRGVVKKLEAMLTRVSDDAGQITLTPHVSRGEVERALSTAANALANYYDQAERLSKKSGKTVEEQIRNQESLIAVRKRQSAELNKILTTLSKSVVQTDQAGAAGFDDLTKSIAQARSEISGLGSELGKLKNLKAVQALQAELKKLNVPKLTLKEAAGEDIDTKIAERRKGLLDLQKTALVAGSANIADQARKDLGALGRIEESLANIRKLQRLRVAERVPTAGLSKEDLQVAQKAKGLLDDMLKSSGAYHASTKKSLESQRLNVDQLLKANEGVTAEYREQQAALKRIQGIVNQIQIQQKAVERFGDPALLKIGSAEEQQYKRTLGKLQGALEAATGTAELKLLGEEEIGQLKEAQQRVNSLIDSQKERARLQEEALKNQKEAAKTSKRLALDASEEVRRIRLAKEASKELAKGDVSPGSVNAKALNKELDKQIRSYEKLILLDSKRTGGKGRAELRRKIDLLREEQQGLQTLAETERAREAQRKRYLAGQQQADRFSLSPEDAQFAKASNDVGKLDRAIDKVGKTIAGLNKAYANVADASDTSIDRQIEDLYRLQKELKDTRAELTKGVAAGGPKESANLQTLRRLEAELKSYDERGPISERIGGARDVESLKAVQRELKEQARSLADINRRQLQYKETASLTNKEVLAKQALVSQGLAKTNDQIYKLTGGWQGLNNTVRQFFRYALFYGGLYEVIGAISLLGRSVVQLQADFKNIQAVTAATEQEMVAISNAVRQVALTTRFSASEITKAATIIGQAGVPASDTQEVLQATANFAAAVGGSIETAADLITTFRDVYSELDQTEISDKLTKAINISKLTSEDLKTIVSISGQTAQDFGLSADQYLAAAGTLRNAGIKASTVTTGLRQLLIDIFAANSSALKKIQGLYNQLGEDLSQQQIRARFFEFTQSRNPLVSALQELERLGVGGRAAGSSGRLFEVRAMNVLRALIRNMDELRDTESRIGFGGAAAKAAATQMEALQAQLTNVGAAMTFFAEELFRGPVEGLTTMAESVTSLIKDLEKLDLQLKATGESGLAKNLGLGALTGLVAGAVTPGGIIKKSLVGLGAGAGVGAGSIAQEQADGGISQEAALGYAAGIIAILTGLGKRLKGLWDALTAGGREKQLSLALESKGVSSGLKKVGLQFLKVRYLFTGWIGVTLAALYGLYELFGDDGPVDLEDDIERLSTAKDSAYKLLRTELDEANKVLQQASDYDPEGSGLGGKAVDLADQVKDQLKLIEDVKSRLGASLDSSELKKVLRKYLRSPGAAVAKTGANSRFLKEVQNMLGANEEEISEYAKDFAQILNMEKQIESSRDALDAEVESRLSDVRAASEDTLVNTPLGALEETYLSIKEEIDNAVSGAEEDTAKVADAYSRLVSGTYTAIADKAKETEEELVRGEKGYGEQLRRTTALVVYRLRQAGKFEDAQRAVDDLIRVQREFFDTVEDAANAISKSFAGAVGDLPEPGAYSAYEAGDTKASFTDITGREGEKYAGTIRRAASDFGISARLLASVIKAESSFNPRAVSSAGARGLGQFIPATGAAYGLRTEEDFFNPEKSIRASANHLRDLLDQFNGNLEKALAAYNAGAGAVTKYGGIPPYKETIGYVKKIFGYIGQTPASASEAGTVAQGISQSRAKLEKEEDESLTRRLAALRDLREEYQANILEYAADSRETAKGRKAREYLRDALGGSASSEEEYADELGKIKEALNVREQELGQADAASRERQASQGRLSTILLENQQEEIKLRLERAKREGASIDEYAALRREIADKQLQIVKNQEKAIELSEDKSKTSESQEEALAKLRNKTLSIERQRDKDIEAYSRARRSTNAKILSSEASIAAEQAKRAARIALQSGDEEELKRLTAQLVEAQKQLVERRRQEASTGEDKAKVALELQKLETEEKSVVQAIVEIQKLKYEKLQEDQRPQLEYGATSPEEAQEFIRENAQGINPSKAEELERTNVTLESQKNLYRELSSQVEVLNSLLEQGGLSQEAQLYVTERLRDVEIERVAVNDAIALKQGEAAAASGGIGRALQVFANNATDSYEGLADTIGGSLTNAVSGLTSALFDAGQAGESMSESFKRAFSSFFLGIAKAIAQTLILKAITGGLGLGAASGGVVGGAGAGAVPSAHSSSALYGLDLFAKGGVVKKAEGGLIAGNAGVDTTPGAIVHPNGTASPMLVTHGEAILPQGMVQSLGVANVQSAIARFNRSGEARFAAGGVMADTYARSSDSSESGAAGQPQVKIVNVPGNSVVQDYLQSYDGETVVLNVLERNPSKVRTIMGG